MKRLMILIAGIVGALLIVSILVSIYFASTMDFEEIKSKKPEISINQDSINFIDSINIRKEKIKNQFSAWDDSHIKLVKSIKNAMNDPNSFEHVKTERTIQGDSIILLMTFRGKNQFGALILNQAKGISHIDGQLLEAQFLN